MRCNLVSSSTTVNGLPAKQCLDIDSLRGKTLVIPSNVTRLDNDGFGICRKSVVLGGNADIVFIIDQSGSMFAGDAWINTGVIPNDTIYYQSTGGCSNGATSGNVIVPVLEIPLRTVPRITSGTGCNQYAGDPLQVRATAVRSAIDYIAANSPVSTAGFLSFGSSVSPARRPVQLNTAGNIATAKNGLVISNLSGTTYRTPLDSARRWLNDLTIRKNSKAAIVFISDGANTGPAYLDLVNSTMPPIYGIFLGKNPTSDTINLVQLANLTGGGYYRVPPGRPDSLNGVIKTILNRILQDYDPDLVTVTNTTIIPNQTGVADASQFLNQGNASWQMILDSAVGLVPNAANSIRVIARFREQNTGASAADTSAFILSTTLPAVPGTITIPGSNLIANCFAPTELRWLNAGGFRPAFFTEADTSVRLQLRGPKNGLNVVTSPLSTRRSADIESSNLPRVFLSTDSARFFGAVNMRVAAAATPNSGVLEPLYIDSVIASWVNPRDPRDFARDTLRVRPGNKPSRAYFSTNNLGTDTVSQFPATAAEAWIVIVDNRSTPGFSYTVALTDSVNGFDHETFTLTEVSPGVFSARIPLAPGLKVNNNGRLEFSPAGDQMLALYVDPVPGNGDTATAAAGIGASVQEAAQLVFTDANGIALPNGAVWPLDRGRVYLRYNDDNAIPRIASKTVQLTARSTKLGQLVTQDAEQAVLADSVSLTSTLKSWRGNINTAETFTATPNDLTIEGVYRDSVIATVQAHDNIGQPTGQTLTATLILAHPDTSVSFSFTDSVNAVNPEGPTDVTVTIRDQDFVRNATDTVLATAICPAFGDSVTGLRFPETAPGVYVSEPILRNGLAPNFTDRVLSCPPGADMLISYKDEVYGTIAQKIISETQMPIASPPGQAFISEQKVILSTATIGAVINYTVNDSLPRPGQPLGYADSVNLYATTNLKAVASKPGFLRSRIMKERYLRTPLPSRIFILDAAGNPLPNRTLTDAATGFRILVTTSQGGLGALIPEIRSRQIGDLENPSLANAAFDGQIHSSWRNLNLHGGALAPIPNNDTLETRLPDTVIAIWRNPLDSNDVVADTAFIVPVFAVSTVYFSNALGGPRVTQFPSGTTTVYVVDSTRSYPGFPYSVRVTSSNGGSDVENYPLAEVSPGVFSVAVPVQPGAVKISGDASIQVAAAGDQLQARVIHPIFGDTTYGVAGYNEAAQELALLRFLDTLGFPLAPDAVFSPANAKILVRYSDDWSPSIDNAVHQKALRLVLNAYRGGAILAVDSETVTMTYNTTDKFWEGTYPLRDRLLKSHNDTVESQFRGGLSGMVSTHDNAGVADGKTEEASLIIAYPDQLEDLQLTDTRGGDVTRVTDSVSIVLQDQAYTVVPGARVTAQVHCLNSGDVEDSVWLVGNGSGRYSLPVPLRKEEGSSVSNDGILSCLQSDIVEVDYMDPVYGNPATAIASWSTPGAVKMRFASRYDSSEITSITDTETDFLVIVETLSPTRNLRDTMWVRLTTAQGELDSFPAVETGVSSGVFAVSVPFKFLLAPPVRGNRQLEAQLNTALTNPSVLVTGGVRHGPDSAQALLTLFSKFNPAVRGYARDINGDGRADWVSVVFAKPLMSNLVPQNLDSLYWNSEIPVDRRSSGVVISQDGLTLQMDLTRNSFSRFLTGIPPVKPPVAKLPGDVYFGALSVPLSDSVGPVPHTAIKLPSDLTTYSFGNQVRVQPDTLLITVSEKMAPASSWSGVFRTLSHVDCEDSASSLNSSTVLTLSEGITLLNDTTFKLLLDNAPGAVSPKIGDCIYLENDGRFKDVPGNRPGFLGVALRTAGASLSPIYGMIGYPPVAGLDPVANRNAYNLANMSDPNTRSRTTMDGGGNLAWVPPVDFPASWSPGDSYTPKLDTGGQDGKTTRSMPRGISTLEVLASQPFTAHVHLYDHFGGFVKSWTQMFGYNHEMDNPDRRKENDFIAAYLIWDERDSRGQLVGSGVYVWKVTFILDDGTGRQFTYTTRTGLVRQ